MLIKPIEDLYYFKGEYRLNNLININSTTEIYKSYIDYEYEGNKHKLQTIVFLFLNKEEATWVFESGTLRDMQYNRLVGVK